MVSKQRWTAGTLALAGLICFAGTGVPAAAEPLRLAASHQQLATKSNPNGTGTVKLAITLTNTGSVAAEDVRLILLKGPGLPVVPGRNVLAVGALAPGQTVTLTWPITVLAPVAATRVPLIVIHAEGIAAGATMPVSTGVLSRAGNNPRAKANSAGSASEPVAAGAAANAGNGTERVSVDSAGNQGNLPSYSTAISADGRFVAFASDADNLVPGDTNGQTDIFVHDRKTGATERVSIDSAGNQGNLPSFDPAISANGRFVAFRSDADNLVPGDTNGGGPPFGADVFVHDRRTGATERVSIDSAGNQGNLPSFDPAISANGRFVAFSSFADNLVPGDTNGGDLLFGAADVFVHDRRTGVTTRVSVDSAGNQANNGSLAPAISANGRFVAFSSDADNLVPGDTNGGGGPFLTGTDAFVHDHKTGATERVSIDSAGNQGNLPSYSAAISANGRFVAFSSDADNLVPGDTNGETDAFVHDRKTGATERVSIDSAGNQGNNFSYSAAISANGRFVAFGSLADNLVPGDTNGQIDVFVHDRKTGE
jgi:Tol biopolymer transport system component